MGFLGALAGYVGGKATVAVLTLGLYAGAAGAAIITPVFPPAAAASITLFYAADAAGMMLISPIDPITAVTTTTIGAGTGPV
jgi:hypothetical protein